KSLFIVGNHLEAATAKVIKDWVKTGGSVGGYAGGGFLDEHNRPLDTLKEVYGIKDQKLERHDTVIMTKQELPRLVPLDRITGIAPTPKRSCDALAFKQTYVIDDAEVEAKYKDGSPAILQHEYGKGVGMLYGSFVASAYMRGAIPVLPFD